jgi:hypothetical protein
VSFISQRGEKYGTCSANKKNGLLTPKIKGAQLFFIHAPVYFHMQIRLNGDLMKTIDLSKQHLLKGESKSALVLLFFDPSGNRNLELYPRTLLSPFLRKNHRKHAVKNLFHRPQRAACQIISSLEWLRARVSRFYMIIANTAGSL